MFGSSMGTSMSGSCEEIVSLRRELAQAQEALEVAKAGVLHTELKFDEMKAAVGQTLAALADPDGDALLVCQAGCTDPTAHHERDDAPPLATEKLRHTLLCPECAERAREMGNSPRPVSYAPAILRLRALFEDKSR